MGDSWICAWKGPGHCIFSEQCQVLREAKALSKEATDSSEVLCLLLDDVLQNQLMIFLGTLCSLPEPLMPHVGCN